MAQPEATFRCGRCHASVWVNEIDRGDGGTGTVRNVSFQKRYKDSNDEWKSSSSLNVNEIPKAILALQKAYEHIMLGNNQNRTEDFENPNAFE